MGRKEIVQQLMTFVEDALKNSDNADLIFSEKVLLSGVIPSVEWVDYQLISLYISECRYDEAFRICKKYENSRNKILVGCLAEMYRDGIGTKRNKKKYLFYLGLSYDLGAVWRAAEYVDELIHSKTIENYKKAILICDEHYLQYPILLTKKTTALFNIYGPSPIVQDAIKEAYYSNAPEITDFIVYHATQLKLDQSVLEEYAGISTKNNEPSINLMNLDEKLIFFIESDELEPLRYKVFCNYEEVDAGEISPYSKQQYIMRTNGIYYVVCELPGRRIIRSNVVEKFDEQIKKEFNDFVNTFESTNSPLAFQQSNYPYFDFVYVNTSFSNDEFFNNFDKLSVGSGAIYVSGSCNLCLNQIVSGVWLHDNRYYRGMPLDADGASNPLCSAEDIGCFTAVTISEELTFFTDYFGKGKLYYYEYNDLFIISNRYHLLAITISKINPNFEIDYAVLNSYFNSYVDVLSLQSVNSRQIIKNSRLLPIGKTIVIRNGQHVFHDTNYRSNVIDEDLGDEKYIAMMDEAIVELVNNLNVVLNSGHYKNCLIDVTGGIDSRIILALLLKTDVKDLNVIPLTKSYDKKDTAVASELLSRTRYTYDDSVSDLFDYIITTEKLSKITREQYLDAITSLSLDSFDPNAIVPFFNLSETIHLGGFDGESFTRPHMSLGSRKWLVLDETPRRISEEYIKSTVTNGIVDYTKSGKYLEDLLADSLSRFSGSSCSIFEQIYPNYPARFHFDPYVHYSFSTDSWIPFMSKKLFDLYWSTINSKKMYSFVFDLTKRLSDILYSVPYAGNSDDMMRVVSSKYMLEKQLPVLQPISFKNERRSTNGTILVHGEEEPLLKYKEYFSVDETILLEKLKSVSCMDHTFKDSLGMGLYYYIKYSSKSKKVFRFKASYFYLYKKLALVETILNLKIGRGFNQSMTVQKPLKIQIINGKLVMGE